MSTKRSNWGYPQRYEALYGDLYGAYADYFALMRIQYCLDNTVASNPITRLQVGFRKKILILFSRSIQSDLCLSICRMYVDGDDATNTFNNLQTFLRETKQIRFKPSVRFRKNTPAINAIKDFRDYYLAHTLTEDKSFRIELAYIKDLLDELREWLNNLCFTDLCNSVKPMINEELISLEKDINCGVDVMMSLPNNAVFSTGNKADHTDLSEDNCNE